MYVSAGSFNVLKDEVMLQSLSGRFFCPSDGLGFDAYNAMEAKYLNHNILFIVKKIFDEFENKF